MKTNISELQPLDLITNPVDWILLNSVSYFKTSTSIILLVYAEDGVFWGCWNHGEWVVADRNLYRYSPPFRNETLLDVRIFCEEGEIHLFRIEKGKWNGRILKDLNTGSDIISETHVLWGNRLDDVSLCKHPLFIPVIDSNGVRHAPPIIDGQLTEDDFIIREKENVKFKGWWPLRLKIKHHLYQDETNGIARVTCSRLVKIDIKKPDIHSI